MVAILDQCDRTLAFLGYHDLDEYFASDQWSAIQEQALVQNPTCKHCGNHAVILRVKEFTIKSLTGRDSTKVEPICLRCIDLL